MKKLVKVTLVLFLVGCSSNKTPYKQVLTYHNLKKEQRAVNGKIVKEKFSVNKKTELKHGYYERYDLNYFTLEQGNYENGAKSGIWTTWQEEDQIFIEKDYDNNGVETPLIEKKYLRYPIVLVEERDTLPQGFLKMGLQFDNKCRLLSINVLEGIDEEFNHKIVNEYRGYAHLCNKYNIPISECIEKKESLIIKFRDYD